MINYSSYIEIIKKSQSIVLTTHRNSDGDGIGSAVALYWALISLNKFIRFCTVDEIPPRYSFLLNGVHHLHFQKEIQCDLLIVLDTNSGALCSPLYENILNSEKPIIFIDHHVNHLDHQSNSQLHYCLNTLAASTGEIVYEIINELKINLDDNIANALYSSLTFDTQAFKLVKNSSKSHSIAAKLAEFKINTESIQRSLFAHWTIEKMEFLASLIQSAQFYQNKTVVGFSVTSDQLNKYHLTGDDINDLIDLYTLIPTIKLCYLIRQASNHEFKISFRSALSNYANLVAIQLGGGGHAQSSGAWLEAASIQEVEQQIKKAIEIYIN